MSRKLKHTRLAWAIAVDDGEGERFDMFRAGGVERPRVISSRAAARFLLAENKRLLVLPKTARIARVRVTVTEVTG